VASPLAKNRRRRQELGPIYTERLVDGLLGDLGCSFAGGEPLSWATSCSSHSTPQDHRTHPSAGPAIAGPCRRNCPSLRRSRSAVFLLRGGPYGVLSCRPILAQPVLLTVKCLPNTFYRRETGFSNCPPQYLVTMSWLIYRTVLCQDIVSTPGT
jgi:hypothetical protein